MNEFIDYTVCTPMCPGMFEIVDIAGGANPRPKINKQTKYARILIKPTFKPEDIDTEVIDQEKKVIYRCREKDIPYVLQLIQDKDMKEKMKKATKFTEEQIEHLRYIALCLRFQNNKTEADMVEEQYLFRELLEPLEYDEIVNTFLPLIKDKEAVKRANNKYKLFQTLRKEQLPNFLLSL